MNEIKTMDGWKDFAQKTGMQSFDDYCHPWDRIGEDVYHHFLNVLPPRTVKAGYFQVGEPTDDRKDPKTRKFRPTFPTYIENGKYGFFYLGNCFAGEIEDTDIWIDHKTVRNFLKATSRRDSDGLQKSRPYIVCADGYELSVQAGKAFFSSPRKDLEDGSYTHVEVGPLREYEEDFFPYSADKRKPRSCVNICVPVELVDALIQKHGGFFESRTPYAAAWEKLREKEAVR